MIITDGRKLVAIGRKRECVDGGFVFAQGIHAPVIARLGVDIVHLNRMSRLVRLFVHFTIVALTSAGERTR